MLDEKINVVLQDIKRLKDEIRQKEELLSAYLLEKTKYLNTCKFSKDLFTEEIIRYSRQMLVSEVGISGQTKLKESKVLIVGAGGLGCPAAVYLAGAGIGQITIVDYDEVELTNLHRQILHTEDDIGIPKVESVWNKLHSINRSINIVPLKKHVDRHAIQDLLSSTKYDVVIDGSDNVASRYLLNDACVLNGIPLVSGSALQTEAQLTVFNYEGGPCYRCLFPQPPPPETVTSCGDGGVLGPVPGLIGVLQALQTIKIVVGSSGILSGRFLLFDGSSCTFRNVKLRPRDVECAVCGDTPTIKELIDYEEFCGAGAHDKALSINILNADEQIHIEDLPKKLGNNLVLDVRPRLQFEMCHLPHTKNIPFEDLEKAHGLARLKNYFENVISDTEVYVLCRRGNDSQRAVRYLKEHFQDMPFSFVNVKGGLHAYSKYIDSDFPVF